MASRPLIFLKKRGSFVDAVSPVFLLFDLKMPRWDGKEGREIVKNDPELRLIPIVILTSSEAEKDVVKSYKLHANCYINKPVDLTRFLEVVRAIGDFWLSVVKLPQKEQIRPDFVMEKTLC